MNSPDDDLERWGPSYYEEPYDYKLRRIETIVAVVSDTLTPRVMIVGVTVLVGLLFVLLRL